MKITIIGASGHGRVAADIASLIGYDEIEFLDDNEALTECGKWPVTGSSDMAESCDNDLFVAVGNPGIRKRLMERLADRRLVSLIHPDAVIAEDVSIGTGSVIMAGTVINPGAGIGIGCIINTCASVDHDCILSDYVHVSVGAHLCGTVHVGDSTWIGAGAVVSNNIDICADCMIGAGAVIVNDIDKPGTYIGVPAHISDKGHTS